MSVQFDEKIQQTLANSSLQLAIYTATGRLMQKRSDSVQPSLFPDYQDLRTHANAVKKHTIENLDFYLEQFESQVIAHGGKVIFCKEGHEVVDFVLEPRERERLPPDRQVEIDDHGRDRL